MRYANLHQLLQNSSSTRQYFLSLPVTTQLALHQHNEHIHTASELRHYQSALASCQRLDELGRGFW